MADARFVNAASLEAHAKEPGHRFQEDCSEELLKRIRDGLSKSRFTPKKIKIHCADLF